MRPERGASQTESCQVVKETHFGVKADDTGTQTATASLETPMANPVDKEEDAPRKREETMEISMVK